MQAIEELCELINFHVPWAPDETPLEITAQTELLAMGLLDSLTIRRIVADIEGRTGVVLPKSHITAANFRSPETLWQAIAEARAATQVRA